MHLRLDRLWNGEPSRAPVGGALTLKRHSTTIVMTWDLTLPTTTPRVPDEPPGFVDGLWGWDVLEIFVGAPERPTRYVEVELGPGGHWLALAFDGVRRRTAELRALAPGVVQNVDGPRWRGEARLDGRVIERVAGPPPWRGLLTSVLGGGPTSERSYLTHVPLPGNEPDFHQPDAWPILDFGTTTGSPLEGARR